MGTEVMQVTVELAGNVGAVDHRHPLVARVGVRWEHEGLRCLDPESEKLFP